MSQSNAPGPNGQDDILWRRRDLAKFAGVSVDTINRWEREGICPPPVEIGPRLKGQWRSVWLGWLASRKKAA